jgi:hypothetical protein
MAEDLINILYKLAEDQDGYTVIYDFMLENEFADISIDYINYQMIHSTPSYSSTVLPGTFIHSYCYRCRGQAGIYIGTLWWAKQYK